jgi:DNA-binding transcriptional regulator YhcF (GntR family)
LKLVTAPPKSQQVADVIREQIKSGKIKPGQRLESVRVLAEKFSVGRQVVLSAFDILASEGLVFSHVGRGTFAAGKTAGVVSSKNYRIGFFINQSRVESFCNRNLFLGASEKSGEAGVTMLLAPDDEFELALWTQRKQLDALLVSGRVNPVFIKTLKKLGIPFVILGDYYLPSGLNVIETCDDNVIGEAMRLAWDKFRFKSVGAILGAADLRVSKELTGVIKTDMTERGVICKAKNFSYSDTEEGYCEAEKMFAKNDAPDALFITGQAFPGVARYLFERNNDKCFKRPVIITAASDKHNIMYPELIDVVIYGSAREMGNSGIEEIIKLLDGKISQIKAQTQYSEFEFLN